MRNFFIRSFELLIGLSVVIGLIAVVVGAIGASTAGQGGILAFLAILIGGALYVAFIAGFMYLGVGIYDNTKRTAEAMEALAKKQSTL